MANRISFNLDDYKTEFIGRVAESLIEPVTNQNGELSEVWRQVFVRQSRSDTGLMDIVVSEPKCMVIQDGSCPYMNVMHNHQSLWALKFKGSPLHRFIEAMKDNAKLSINDPEQLKGHTFKFYQWDQPAWFNKKTQQEMKSRPYYFIEGWPEEEAEVAPLPFDPPAQSVQSSAPATNGNAAVTQEDIDELFAIYCDEKTDQQIKQGIVVNKELPELAGIPNFRVNVMSGSAMKNIIDKNLVTKGEDGIYRMVGS